MHKMICEGIKGLTTSMYMLADEMGLIDTESMYAHEMKGWQEKMGKITEAMPLAYGGVKKPPADVVETDEEIIVTMEVPGVAKEDIDISVTCDELYVRAKKSAEPEEEAECVHKRELSYDMFRRMIKLPCAVKSEQAKASLCKGILKITLPKEIAVTRTKIAVEEEVCQ
jgi:HSP20 family molecular chaperone IbpA